MIHSQRLYAMIDKKTHLLEVVLSIKHRRDVMSFEEMSDVNANGLQEKTNKEKTAAVKH